MVDIARDPRWGRIAEGAGEDPYLGAQIARAMVRGYQGDDLARSNALMACVKHFALIRRGGGGAGLQHGGYEPAQDVSSITCRLIGRRWRPEPAAS